VPAIQRMGNIGVAASHDISARLPWEPFRVPDGETGRLNFRRAQVFQTGPFSPRGMIRQHGR
jgi:hypothetical protein